MKQELNRIERAALKSDDDIFGAQYEVALGYNLLMPNILGELPPTEEYMEVLNQEFLPFLPSVVMDNLIAKWNKVATLRLTSKVGKLDNLSKRGI